jgi:hypothetical protein
MSGIGQAWTRSRPAIPTGRLSLLYAPGIRPVALDRTPGSDRYGSSSESSSSPKTARRSADTTGRRADLVADRGTPARLGRTGPPEPEAPFARNHRPVQRRESPSRGATRLQWTDKPPSATSAAMQCAGAVRAPVAAGHAPPASAVTPSADQRAHRGHGVAGSHPVVRTEFSQVRGPIRFSGSALSSFSSARRQQAWARVNGLNGIASPSVRLGAGAPWGYRRRSADGIEAAGQARSAPGGVM